MTGRSATGVTGASTSNLLVNEVYSRLKQEIVRGQLRPNQALTEVEIAERLNVSRTPVRESMQRLASDGLVVSRRRRWVVYEHTKREIQQIYEVRAALEGYATRLAGERITDQEIDDLTRQWDRDWKGLDTVSRVETNEAFHQRIVDVAANQRLSDSLERNRSFYFNQQVASLYSDEEKATSARQHSAILKAVCERDGDTAERLGREHVLAALQIILRRLA
jgi:DNA-binding GntR family transcriptional regulator